ncbi:MAG: pyridoxamine 5'-phosphate oxidase family protein [Proteobacteria bacterium]|jgi:predicted pyridoxine 5'-phosphate oxidase superfamily flavin-nucleotide-binding protein|nr:pyridoxamine 5'-phosphate oxidase family protein [Pseudomonadota bacterium]
MGHKFAEIAFTPAVKNIQSSQGSRASYARMEDRQDSNHLLGEREAEFIGARDSFYMASVSETGWPYVQHRGGPIGFMKVIDEQTIGFADYAGNKQYVSTGNLSKDDRISLFFMDYPNRRRLKMFGRVSIVTKTVDKDGDKQDPETIAKLEDDDYRARIERAFVINVEAFDWNCPQHITPRFTEPEYSDRV